MLRFHVPVTIGLKLEGSPLHKNVPLVIVPWYVCAGAADDELAETTATMRRSAAANRKGDRRRFCFNELQVFIQTSKGTGSQSSGFFLRCRMHAPLLVIR